VLKAKYSREMGRIREKVTLSLRKAIEVIGLNVGPPPNPEHPNFMPRWDFSQSTDEITVTIYVKTCDPTLTYAESSRAIDFWFAGRAHPVKF